MANPTYSQLAEQVLSTSLFSAYRLGRHFVVEMRSPHRVLSTSAHRGGEHEDLRYLVNHQSCEARGDELRVQSITDQGLKSYHRRVCAELDIDPDRTALMGTAANMACIAHRSSEFEDLRADAFVTAGVQGNAATAGDPARWKETEDGWTAVSPYEGTINIILILSFPLTPSAQTRAIVTMTEAKSAALADLAVPSLSSSSIATGTGTDQFCLASPLDGDRTARDSTSPHVKAGEIIGVAVREAVREALRWQNGLESSYTRGIFHALGRFGLTEERIMKEIADLLPEPQYVLLDKNRQAVFFDPAVGAAAHAFASVMDRVRCGTVPDSVAGETLRQQAACLACSLAGHPQAWSQLYRSLQGGADDPLELVVQAVAAGWNAKWT